MRTSKKRKINVEWQRAALGQREIIRILFVFGAILILFMVVNNIPKLIHFSERIQSKASGTEAGIVNLVLGFAFLFVWVIILRLAFRGNLLQAVAIFIMFFPIVQRFTRVYAVTVYSSPFSGSRIMISLTTVTVVLIFFALFHTKGKMLKYEQRPNGLTRLLLVYFLFVLIIQLFHHPPYTALMICFVSLLQPFLFYFVIINVFRKKEDIIIIFS